MKFYFWHMKWQIMAISELETSLKYFSCRQAVSLQWGCVIFSQNPFRRKHFFKHMKWQIISFLYQYNFLLQVYCQLLEPLMVRSQNWIPFRPQSCLKRPKLSLIARRVTWMWTWPLTNLFMALCTRISIGIRLAKLLEMAPQVLSLICLWRVVARCKVQPECLPIISLWGSILALKLSVMKWLPLFAVIHPQWYHLQLSQDLWCKLSFVLMNLNVNPIWILLRRA